MRLKPVALLTGPYDWHAAVLPLPEFETRLAAVRDVMATYNASALIVHGNSAEHGALAYLTNFVPKLGPAFALVSQNAPIRLLVTGSPTMLPAAQRLTWIEDVRPIGDLKESVESWLAQSADERSLQIGLWGDSKLALRPFRALESAIESRGTRIDILAPLENLRIRKSQLEIQPLRRSCEILAATHSELHRSYQSGLGARSIALAAEHAAYRAGAQDARVLVSARPGGPPQFLDFTTDPVIDPLLARVAVRFAGYWSEGFSTLSQSPFAALDAAQRGLAAMLQKARIGLSFAELSSIAKTHLQPYSLHPFVENAIGNSIGLSIEEPCEGSAQLRSEEITLQPDGVYTIRCGSVGHEAENAIVSAMIHVTADRTEALWPPPQSAR